MSKCIQCNKAVNKRSPGLECLRCGLLVHAKSECAGLTNKQLNAIRAAENLEWTCNDCSKLRRKSSLVTPDEDDDEEDEAVDHSQKIVSINSEKLTADITKQVDRILKRETNEVTKSVQYLSDKVDECLESTEAFKQIIKELEKKNMDLRNKNVFLENKINSLEQRMNEAEQRQIIKTVEIAGIPQTQEENVRALTNIVAVTLKMNEDHVKRVQRQPPRSGKPGSIVVEMQDEETKAKWITASREKRMIVADILPDSETNILQDKVYVREALTHYNKILFWKSKQELKEKFKYVWCKSGRIMARKADKDKIIVIRSEEDIYDALQCP